MFLSVFSPGVLWLVGERDHLFANIAAPMGPWQHPTNCSKIDLSESLYLLRDVSTWKIPRRRLIEQKPWKVLKTGFVGAHASSQAERFMTSAKCRFGNYPKEVVEATRDTYLESAGSTIRPKARQTSEPPPQSERTKDCNRPKP